jgi:methylated-DNA-[protein]-cysteine S-methyltransferase
MRYSHLPSPLGDLLLVADEHGLRALYLPTGREHPGVQAGWVRDDRALAPAREQLAEYFAGQRRVFDLSLAAAGSRWQHRVWAALCEIGYGETASYGQLARELGVPNGARAVGLANGQNPISIIVPCHRVIGANGALTGYGGGLPAKQWLLSHEAAHSGLFAP